MQILVEPLFIVQYTEILVMEQKTTLEILKEKRELLKTDLNKLNIAIEVLERYDNNHKDNPTETSSKTFDSYDKNWTITEKLLFVLNLLGRESTMGEVASKIYQIDDKYTRERIDKFCSVKLSRMAKDGIINARKEGHRNMYSVKPKK